MGNSSRAMHAGLIAVMAVIASLAVAAPASALNTVNTTLGSFSDPRADLPARPGTIVQARYGPFNIPAASGPTLGQIHNQIDSITAPCSNCYITDMVPSLVFGANASTPGATSTANLDGGVMMHHFSITNPGKQDATCPGAGQGQLGDRFFAAGNERTHVHLPGKFGYQNLNGSWTMITHLVNRNTTVKTVWIEVTWRHIAAGDPVRPIWLDVDGMGAACGDSEYTIPGGYSDTHQQWTSTVSGRFVAMSGHMHDVDITGQGACLDHCAAEGGGIATSAELVGGPASDYYGPNPPNNPPPADITGRHDVPRGGLLRNSIRRHAVAGPPGHGEPVRHPDIRAWRSAGRGLSAERSVAAR